MPDRIPIEAAKQIAKDHGCRQVILVAWDGQKVHIVTYGVNIEECDLAAIGGNMVAKALGWPESLCNAEPSRVKKLRQRIKELEAKLTSGMSVESKE
jgi:hypothetical protein